MVVLNTNLLEYEASLSIKRFNAETWKCLCRPRGMSYKGIYKVKAGIALRVMCPRCLDFYSAFLKRGEVYDTENCTGSVTGRKGQDRLFFYTSQMKNCFGCFHVISLIQKVTEHTQVISLKYLWQRRLLSLMLPAYCKYSAKLETSGLFSGLLRHI